MGRNLNLGKEERSMGSNGRVVEGQGEPELNPLVNKADLLLKQKERYHNALAEALKSSMKLQQASAKWGKPGQTDLAVRREGVFGRKNPTDLKRYEAEKANKDRYILLGKHLTDTAKYAASGKKFLMEVMQYTIEMDADLPEELQPLGQACTEIIQEILTGTFAEDLTMLSALGLEEIARAFKDTEA